MPDFSFEDGILERKVGHVAGCDEAGRGPLAGPVVAAAVIVPRDADLPGLDDSKALTAKKRDLLFETIHVQALAIGVCSMSAETIDQSDIRKASLIAMARSLAALSIKPDACLFDGRDIPEGIAPTIAARAVIGGDAKSKSIAAASIIAKVTRDRMMVALDKVHPAYGFASHKGYGGAAAHRSTIEAEGGVPRVHRFSFSPLRQRSLFKDALK